MLRLRFEYCSVESPAFPSPIAISGQALMPIAAGALYWDDERTLIVADLHLEKGAAYAARGLMLPPYDTRSTLRRLAACIGLFNPRRVVALGDSFHRSELADRLDTGDREDLAALQRGRDWNWVLGNHDPSLPPSVGGIVCSSLSIGGIMLRHEPSAGVGIPEIAGHPTLANKELRSTTLLTS